MNKDLPIERTIHDGIAALREFSPAQLRQQYLKAFGEPTRSGNKDFLCKRIAWRIQSIAEGGLSDRAKQRAAELARDADIRTTIPKLPALTAGSAPASTPKLLRPSGHRIPIPGTMLTRVYKNKLIQVRVLAEGFDYAGQSYRSLSAIAKAITGTQWNGYLFFGLKAGIKA